MGRLIAIDPGINYTGLAKFSTNPIVLTNVLLIKRKELGLHLNIQDQCSVLYDFCWNLRNDTNADVIIELPRIYPEKNIRANDIIDLAVVAGSIGTTAAIFFDARLNFVYPKTWKGDTPKSIHNQRILEKVPKLKELLKPYPKGQHEHIIDAVGIGLWFIGTKHV